MIRYEDISTAIQVRHLQVELSEAVTFQPGDAADVAAQLLSGRGFDQAPVLMDPASSGSCGPPASATAQSPWRIGSSRSIRSTSFRPTLPSRGLWSGCATRRASSSFPGAESPGFFVEADLNKQPARTYFYLLVASLEAGLARLIREWTRSDEARLLGAMPARVRDRALKARADARIEDFDADLVSYLLFSDILRVIEGLPKGASGSGSRARRSGTQLRTSRRASQRGHAPDARPCRPRPFSRAPHRARRCSPRPPQSPRRAPRRGR